MEEKEDKDPSWFKFALLVFRILFAVLLFGLIILSYFFPQKFEINWLIIIVCWTLLVYLLFDKIIEFSIGPSGVRVKGKQTEALSEEKKKEIENKVKILMETATVPVALATHDLNRLINDYSYFYGHWDNIGKSDVIRFSDAWSGRPLRYINHFADDINEYLAKYSQALKEPLRKAIEELKEYIDFVKQFQKDGESLTKRCFSRYRFTQFMNSVVENFKEENFGTAG